MDDAARVRVGERRRRGRPRSRRRRGRRACRRRSQAGERLAGDQLGDQHAPGRRARRARRGSRSTGWLRRAAAWASRSTRSGSSGVSSLSATCALEPLVEGPVDGAHPAGADPLDHAEAAHHQLIGHDLHPFAGRAALLPWSGGLFWLRAGFILCAAESDLGQSVAFLDEDELQPAGSGAGSRRAGL